MKTFAAFAATMLILAPGIAEANDEIPAVPIQRIAPEYPVACMPREDEFIIPQTVTVLYDVNPNGAVENVRVAESSNPCFEDVSISAVRGWYYERGRGQTGLETTFSFVLEEETRAIDFDARVLSRVPPQYPDRCQDRAKNKESVIVEFDISSEGIPENVQVIESTNSCFNHSALSSVRKWRYRPRLVDGEPTTRKDVVTGITFLLASGASAGPEIRRPVLFQLKRVERLLKRKDYEKALQVLNEIEEKYGDSFSSLEHSTFLRLRAGARIEVGDYAGALDDLRIVQRTGWAGKAGQAVGDMILQLEAVVAESINEPAEASEENKNSAEND